ncbi:MAG: 2-oxo acid dehydrogenase subunit E2 [Sphingobacteriales bacterium]|nr:2-oxo acid dehydrogenase subunit E2 [Sphingobacteriales bacterium]
MAQYELVLPKMGESVAEATIIKWVKNAGDSIDSDESVLEIATDKVDSEVPSPVSGKLVKTLFNEGDVVKVGAVIAIIETEAASASVSAPAAASSVAAVVEAPSIKEVAEIVSAPAATTVQSSENRFYSPLVKSIASSEGISQAELDKITGTGQEGRVTKQDILDYVASKSSGKPSTSAAAASTEAPKAAVKASAPTEVKITAPTVTASNGDEIIEMDRMRKLIADHMVMSKHVSPHVTSFVEADVTNLVRWREKVKKEFEKREGEKITFTPIFIEALVKAIKDFPMINISLSGTQIIKRKNINIGMAAALPSGNLIVPVIKNADQMNLVGLTRAVNDLANRARSNKLTPDEISGGTYTLTNVGSFGNVMGTPIINQPQVAIMAVGAIRKMPSVIETPDGDMIAIRHKMYLSHSYDHRVVDGSLGGQFVRRVADYLESFDVNREF